MTWKLFLDDERVPADLDTNDYIVCRNLDEVKSNLKLHGSLEYATFDHDLGEGQPTGMDVVEYLVQEDMTNGDVFTNDFTWYSHSQNPVGVMNINSYLQSYFRLKDTEQQILFGGITFILTDTGRCVVKKNIGIGDAELCFIDTGKYYRNIVSIGVFLAPSVNEGDDVILNIGEESFKCVGMYLVNIKDVDRIKAIFQIITKTLEMRHIDGVDPVYLLTKLLSLDIEKFRYLNSINKKLSKGVDVSECDDWLVENGFAYKSAPTMNVKVKKGTEPKYALTHSILGALVLKIYKVYGDIVSVIIGDGGSSNPRNKIVFFGMDDVVPNIPMERLNEVRYNLRKFCGIDC